MTQRTYNNVPASDLAFVLAVIRADGGTAAHQQNNDGTFTVTATFDPPATIQGLGVTAAEPTWMPIARKEVGTKEVIGQGSNPRILQYQGTCSGGTQDDAVPWCSAFVNFCVKTAGFVGTNSLAARSWTDWGNGVTAFQPGAIVVLWRGSLNAATGHVGFYIGTRGDQVLLLGGNQGDEVNVRGFPLERVIAKRMSP